MTMGSPKFDGDSHASVRYFLGMTMLFDATVSYTNSNFSLSRIKPPCTPIGAHGGFDEMEVYRSSRK